MAWGSLPDVQRAEYPEKTCREPLFNDHGLGYSCELVQNHPGPCASFSIAPTVSRRTIWEQDNPEWRKDIGNLDIEV